MARIIVFPRTPNFFSFFILEKSYDKRDDFDHQASREGKPKETDTSLNNHVTIVISELGAGEFSFTSINDFLSSC